MSKSLHTTILIDDSNFFFKLKGLKIKNLLNFDFGKFPEFLAGDKPVFQVML